MPESVFSTVKASLCALWEASFIVQGSAFLEEYAAVIESRVLGFKGLLLLFYQGQKIVV